MGKDQPASKKKAPPEEIDDALNEIDQLLECWQNRLTVDNLALTKRYAKGEVGMGIEVRLKECDSKQFVALFERKRGSSGVGYPRRIDALKVCANRNDCAVFVDYVETLQAPEGFPQSSTIWLQPSNEFFGFWPDALKERSRLSVRETGTIPTYWEVGFTDDCFGNRSLRLVLDQADSQAVKGCPEIVNNIANDPGPRYWDVLNYMNLVYFYCGLGILINDDSVRLSRSECGDLGAEIVKVFFGPVELDADSGPSRTVIPAHRGQQSGDRGQFLTSVQR